MKKCSSSLPNIGQQIKKEMKKNWYYYVLLLLPFLYFILFKYGAMLGNIIAFRKFQYGGSIYGSEWVGLKYFKMFIYDPQFWRAFKNTIIISFYSIIFSFPLPIIFALLLNEFKNGLFKKTVQTISYLPHFISIVIIVGIAKEMLSPSSGIVNQILVSFGYDSISFFMDSKYYRPIYIILEIWQHTGYSAIIYLAALSGIDMQLYESAMIDGANRFKQTWYITIPGILPTIVILLIMKVGNVLSVGFEKVLLLTNPAINSVAEVISTYVYNIGVVNSNYSLATAIGMFEAIVGLIFISSANYIARKISDVSLW